MEEYKGIISLVLLIVLSGFFSGTETALTAFKQVNLEDNDEKQSELLKRWLKKPNEMLTAILLGNNVVNILASSIATILAVNFFKDDSQNAIVWVTAILTIVILVFGEITPKIIAKNNSEKISKFVIVPIYYLSVLAFPIILILTIISKFIARIIGIEIKNENLIITEDDIRSMINAGKIEGVLEEEEESMIHGIFEFGDRTAKEIMVPRTNMYAIEGNSLLREHWDSIIKNGYSRIPIFEKRMDNIIGVVYSKDLLELIKEKNLDVPIKNYIRKAYFVPESKLLFELLQEMKEKKVHITIVLDEYGGTMGVVTIEDIIEEIVGEINDEYDTEEEKITELSENKYIVDAIIDIPTLNKQLNIELPEEEDFETLGGFIYSQLGRVTEIGDKIEWGNILLEVTNVDHHKITGVKIEVKTNEIESDQFEGL